MRRLGVVFDDWVTRGPFVAQDLVRYRRIFAVLLLIGLPDYEWVSAYPDSLYRPPLGPFMLLSGFPPPPFFTAVEVALAICLAALIIGLWTRPASLAAAALMLIGWGYSYSLGKIDHSIFVVLTPLVLVFTSWGWSARGDRRAMPQWPMRLFALLVGIGFFTAAAPKALNGWLAPGTHVLQETAFRQFYVNGRTEMLADQVVAMPYGLLWEVGDWSIVILEAAVLLSVLDWRAFRVVIAVLAIFHLAVYPTMNINFANNVIVYGAFVSWSAVPLPGVRRPRFLRAAWPQLIGVLVLGVTGWALRDATGGISRVSSVTVLIVGAGVGLTYLAINARRVGRHDATSTGWRRRSEITPSR